MIGAGYVPVPVNPGDALELKAIAAHVKQPELLLEIVRVSREMRAAGWQRWSINAAFEVVRFQSKDAGYQLNNNHRAFYARWIMRDVPELAGFFATRRTLL